MTSLDNLIVGVSGRLSHEWDFTFYKNNGELANRIRKELGSNAQEIKIDNEGAINIETGHQGSYYITPAAVVAVGWLTNAKSLSEQKEIAEFAGTMESIYRSKGPFTIDSCGVRLFFRFVPENGLALLRAHSFEGSLRSILGNRAPSDSQSFNFSTRYIRDRFSDLVELEASSTDVQLRYSRDSVETGFPSYHAFLSAINLKSLVEDLRPICEVLVAAEPPKRNLKTPFV